MNKGSHLSLAALLLTACGGLVARSMSDEPQPSPTSSASPSEPAQPTSTSTSAPQKREACGPLAAIPVRYPYDYFVYGGNVFVQGWDEQSSGYRTPTDLWKVPTDGSAATKLATGVRVQTFGGQNIIGYESTGLVLVPITSGAPRQTNLSYYTTAPPYGDNLYVTDVFEAGVGLPILELSLKTLLTRTVRILDTQLRPFATDDEFLYLKGLGGEISRLSYDGTRFEPVGTFFPFDPVIRLIGDYFYSYGPTRMRKDGVGGPTKLVASDSTAYDFAVDDKYVFYMGTLVPPGDAGPWVAALTRVRIEGGAPEIVRTNFPDYVGSLAVDDACIYYAAKTSVQRMKKP